MGRTREDEEPPLTEVRLDVWLDVSCLFPTRSQAAIACTGGKVDLNGRRAAAHRLIRAGDRLEITFPRGRRTFLVKGLAERHVKKSDARSLVEETTPPLAPEVLEARRRGRLLAPRDDGGGGPPQEARGGRGRGGARVRALLKPRALVDLVRLLAVMPLTSYVYSWLKVAVPLLRPDVLYDRGLFRLETVLHFGVNPGRLLQGLFPYPALWKALDGYYGTFMFAVLAGVGWFAATLSIRDRARFAAGFTLLWVLGS